MELGIVIDSNIISHYLPYIQDNSYLLILYNRIDYEEYSFSQ
jgi:hypothetical protein